MGRSSVDRGAVGLGSVDRSSWSIIYSCSPWCCSAVIIWGLAESAIVSPVCLIDRHTVPGKVSYILVLVFRASALYWLL